MPAPSDSRPANEAMRLPASSTTDRQGMPITFA
jgi:hypothetical protein